MAMEVTGNYNSYAAQGMAESGAANSTKKKESEKTAQVSNSGKSKSTADYQRELANLAPSVDFRVGSGFSSAKNGKTLTLNPKLLEKMQNNPEKEKEIKELIKGVESATKLVDGLHRAGGWKVVYRHGYIDENGKYSAVSYVRNEFGYKMSEKLREERRENSEKLLERQKEKAADKKAALQESLEEKRSEGDDEKAAPGKAEQLLNEKLTASKNGIFYLYDTDLKTLTEAAKEASPDKANTKDRSRAGANLDLQV